MSQQTDAAWELHLCLTAAGVPYAIIGGLAVQFWGEPRFTQDVDVTVVAPLEAATAFIEHVAQNFAPRISDAVAFETSARG